MIAILRNPSFAKLFAAQVLALIGTGMLTVALGLLAYDLAGTDAGIVLGIALTLKMVAYVGVAPIAAALIARLPRTPVLVTADLIRAAIAALLPFVSEAWQIYVLIFVLQTASATFTPAFQAVIPSILPDEREYTRALSLSRLAYDLESLLSPLIAAALLVVVSFHQLFAGTVVGFLASATLVLATRLPPSAAPRDAPFLDRVTAGLRSFAARPELRGLTAINLVVATGAAMVIVNTVVLVQSSLGRGASEVAVALGAYGAGSMGVALVLPALLESRSDRSIMLAGAAALPLLLLSTAAVLQWGDGATEWILLLVIWSLLGAANSAILTPSARVLRRNSTEQDRPAVFAAQFSVSHACFLLAYPLAGIAGAKIGLPMIAIVLAALGAIGAVAAGRLWPKRAAEAERLQ